MSPAIVALRHRLETTIVACHANEPTPPPAADGSWPDIDYQGIEATEWPPTVHLSRTRRLALRSHGVATDEAASVRDQALAALRWWLLHDPQPNSWWHRQIGAPRLFGEAALLLADHLGAEDIAGCRRILERAGDFILMPGWAPRAMSWTGANRLWISVNRVLLGALVADEAIVSDAVASAAGEIRIAPRDEDGIQADFSFHQHGPLLFNGGYGRSFLLECGFLLRAVHGTPWQPGPATYRLLADFLLDGTRWMLRGEDWDFGCRDREITRPRLACRDLAPVADGLAEACPERIDELRDLAASLTSGAAPGALRGNRMFPRSDFMVQQEPGWRVSVRMHSLRTARAECCNREGRRSHHLADGLTCLMRTGGEYRDVFPVWDWQRLPGITCLRTPRIEQSDTVYRRGAAEAVGGGSDGRFGVCTQHLRSDHLVARKSWFFGPEGVVCLGSDIRSAFAGEIVTALDQSRVQGPVLSDAAPREPLAPGARDLRAVRWLQHGPWGFWFPAPTNVRVELGPRTGAWSDIGNGPSEPVTKDIFLAHLSHGECPEGATYAYAILPGADADALARFTVAPDFEIVRHDGGGHAVWRPAARLLQATFFGAGELSCADGWRLRVEGECAVQIDFDERGAIRLFAAETRQLGEFFEGRLVGPEGVARWEGRVPFPDGVAAGTTLRII